MRAETRTRVVRGVVPALLVAALASGCSGSGEATDGDDASGRSEKSRGVPAPWFQEEAEERGLVASHRTGHREIYYMPEIVSGGGGLVDMDGDGDLDVYLVQGGSLVDPALRRPGNRLFENVGDGRFVDVSDGSGADDEGFGMGLACGDYDDDGDVDLYVTNVGRNTLLRNDGDGHFTDVTDRAGVGHPGFGSSAGFFDYDRDGDLDLFVVNYIRWAPEREIECFNRLGAHDYCSPLNYNAPAMDVLYRNEGDGRFVDVTAESGMNLGFGNGLGYVVADFDGNGWLDVFVANDALVDQLWLNQGDGTFVDRALIAGCAVDMEGGVPKAGMGVTSGDIDGDGDPDLMVCNLKDESDSVYRNDGSFFTDITARAGLATVSRRFTRFGMGWVDFDNDGQFDLYQADGRVKWAEKRYADDVYAEPNLLFRGLEDARFEEVTPRGGTDSPLYATSRAAAFGDVDDDGGTDVLVVNRDAPVQLLHNVVPDRGNFIRFRVLEGVRDAEGAVVEVEVGGRTLRRDVRSGYSYLACNDPRILVGLGRGDKVDAVRVRWVDGAVDEYGPLPGGTTHVLRRRAPRAGAAPDARG